MRHAGLQIVAVFVCAIAVVVAASVPANAFDGERKGFVIGLGCGVGRTSWGLHHSGVFTNFKVGYAPNNRVMLLWHSSGTFFNAAQTGAYWEMDGMGGLSVQVYLSAKGGRLATSWPEPATRTSC